MKAGPVLVVVAILAALGVLLLDRLYVPRFEREFAALEKQRIVTSNKLATAKIVHENLNHVRDLVFKNMDFAGQSDTIPHETHVFDFLTTCLNDLKLTLVSAKPERPVTKGRITTYGYELELEGDFFTFGELCSKFENSRRITALTGFDVNLASEKERRQGGPEHKKLKIKMSIETFRVKKSSTTPGGSAPTTTSGG
jgi:Tfp pilus assembly protein PilO